MRERKMLDRSTGAVIIERITRKMTSQNVFHISAALQRFPGRIELYYVDIHPDVSLDISLVAPKRGWGSVKVSAKVNNTVWKTALFRKKSEVRYIMLVKAAVRNKEKMDEDDKFDFSIELL
jgi:hypothetical protein